MQNKRRAVTVATTFFLAAATGHVMQNGETIAARLRGEPAPAGTAVLDSVTSTAATIAPAAAVPPAPTPTSTTERDVAAVSAVETDTPSPTEEVALQTALDRAPSGLPDLPKVDPKPLSSGIVLAARMDRLDEGYARTSTAADADYSVFGIACADPALTLEASARAMVKVSLAAPCFANERVTISHEGLTVAMATDMAGDLSLMLPALASDAKVEVGFASGDTVSATRAVSGLDALSRTAIAWEGAKGFHLHAFEGGADFDTAGHVSFTQPRDRATEEGGFLTVLGDPAVDHPMMAEIYTAPSTTTVDRIVVEAMVNADTCGKTLAAVEARVAGTGGLTVEPLRFSMPGCDAVGDSLLLSLDPLPPVPVAVALGQN